MGIHAIVIIIFSYFLGCINFGYYYVRYFYKQDVRTVGTNVTGAMNVSRIAGKKGFLITFACDAIKGAIPVVICRILQLSNTIAMVCILMVIIGHIFPFQLSFQGGKGLSTAFGAYLIFNPILIIYLLLTCALLLPFVRRFTVTSLFSLVILPAELYFGYNSWVISGFFLLYTTIILYACRGNIVDFFRGKQDMESNK